MKGETDELKSPAGFAKGLTEAEISAFLRVSRLDCEKPAHEIASNGRVRWFVRHVLADISDRYPTADTDRVFRLPLWFQHEWNIKASMAKLAWQEPGSAPRTLAIDESMRMNAEETEKFIRGMEGLLIGKVRNAIARFHRKASVVGAKNGIATEAPSMTLSVAANSGKKSPEELITFDPPRNGWAVAQKGYCPAALWNTNESIVQTLGAIKIVVGRTCKISPNKLRESFPDSELYTAAGSNDWQDIIDSFKSAPQMGKSDNRWKVSTPKTVAARFLARALDLTPGTMKRKISQAKPKKRKKTRKVLSSNFG